MASYLIAANWKMHGTKDWVNSFLQKLSKETLPKDRVEWLILAPFSYLLICESLLSDSHVCWGAQNVSSFSEGAYTGEISAQMLSDCLCSYVLIGHSERRQYFSETSPELLRKLGLSIGKGLIPILCVGETGEQRKAGQTISVITQQLEIVKELTDNLDSLPTLVIAYEPVWAIGTGQQATPDQAQEVHALIRRCVCSIDTGWGLGIRLLYGGSVKPANAAGLFNMPDVNGALIGGASLQVEQLIEIGQLC